MPGIIVGVDGSDESGKALGWAMREAALRHVPLTVVTVREPPVRLATQIYWGVHTFPDGGLSHEQMKQSVREFVGKVASEVGQTVPGITVSVVTGRAAQELINASGDADLLVVGSRGAGGFARLLMGSVSMQVTYHAKCPVVVIPAAR
jgi:nucleotide-binding universal stress UspA family protein